MYPVNAFWWSLKNSAVFNTYLPVKNVRLIYVFGKSLSMKSDQFPEQFKAFKLAFTLLVHQLEHQATFRPHSVVVFVFPYDLTLTF